MTRFVPASWMELKIGTSGMPLGGSDAIQLLTTKMSSVSGRLESNGGIWMDGRLPRSRVEMRVSRIELAGDCGAMIKLLVLPKLFTGIPRIKPALAVEVVMRASQLARCAVPPG